MFKGLRTKIESEKGRDNQVSKSAGNLPSNNDNNQKNSNSTSTNTEPHSVGVETLIKDVKKKHPPAKPVQQQTDESRVWSTIDARTDSGILQGTTIGQLREQLTTLSLQLEIANREKEIGNEQNAQLYQLIEKLRRNLESEKETNSILQSKLEQSELALKEKTDLIESLENTPSNISPFGPKHKSNHNVPVTMKDLSSKVSQLQTQVSEKNRQLKVCNQTANDIRKALQQEVLEHNKTKETCNKLRTDLKQLREHPPNGPTVHNGSILQGDIDVTHRKNSLAPTITTNELQDFHKQQHVSNLDKDEKVLHLDKISIHSKSSASVYDFDPNDLSSGINSKDVNHEYLRNVLFRYMTSNDKETTQHLVKAISVMMNFTREQSDAIKCAMNSRLSWLRLK